MGNIMTTKLSQKMIYRDIDKCHACWLVANEWIVFD